ncbi:MAG: HNH endonuclease signature motif containing protein [Alphaproteobacteria bacterium]|nr:HNH endonuclease signature motif containing protein [Alphaproteobacteria bacterium]
MPTMPPTFGAPKLQQRKDQQRLTDRRRGSAAQRGYDGRWRKAREAFLAKHPLCEMDCEAEGRVTPATVVDHIVPHKGDRALFWDRSNWQAGCETCHNRKTAREDGGFGRTPR